MSSMEAVKQAALTRFPNLRFCKESSKEVHANCPSPLCNGLGQDRWILDNRGLFWCRVCHTGGNVYREPGKPLTAQQELELRLIAVENEQRRLARWQEAHDAMHRCQDHLRYAAHPWAVEVWQAEGFRKDTIVRHQLGWCDRTPLDWPQPIPPGWEPRPSLAIPFLRRGELQDIRHRVIGAGDGEAKYRPHRKDLGNHLYLHDTLDESPTFCLLCEGEKKALAAREADVPSVGISGTNGFEDAWLPDFAPLRRVYVVLDPDVRERRSEKDELNDAERLALKFGERGRVVWLPGKLDDCLLHGGMTRYDLEQGFLRHARPVTVGTSKR